MLYIFVIINYLPLERRKTCHHSLNILHLARALLSKICTTLISSLKKIITSEDFIARHRKSPQDFTRQRKLPFHVLIVFLFNFLRGSYQDELDTFFQVLGRSEVADRVVTKAALVKARMKLKYEAFIDLNRHLVSLFYHHCNFETWQGFRILAIDGTTVRLPHTEEITQHFGVWNVRQGKASPMARISQLFDTLNGITVDAVIGPKRTGERELALSHLACLSSKDLVLIDRGYPAWWFFAAVLESRANFCARMSCTKWKIVEKFFHSGAKETIVSLPVSKTSLGMCQRLKLSTEPLTVRLIRIDDGVKTQILATSLVDARHYPFHIFRDLYHKRWPVEEDYKIMKRRVELENFSGLSVLSIQQDFHAMVFAKNLVSMLAFQNRTPIAQATTHRKHDYKTNFTQAISKSKHVIALLFYETESKVRVLIEQLLQALMRIIEPVRHNRNNPRNHKVSMRKHFTCYKQWA